MILLQVPVDPEKVLDRNFGISPDTVLGLYVGMLVLLIILLVFVIYRLYSAREKDRDELKVSEAKSIEVLGGVSKNMMDMTYQVKSLENTVNDKYERMRELIKDKVS